MAIVIFTVLLLSWYYYQSQEKLMLAQQRASLSKYAYIQTKRLKVLHHFFDDRVTYPRDSRFNSAIFDLEYKKIFSLLDEKRVKLLGGSYLIGEHIHLVKILDEFYLGAKYLIIEIKNDTQWQGLVWKNILFYGIMSFIIFMLFGLYFAKLFLKPMRNSIVLLDRFIKDTTHELNTPLSAILANIEMMDRDIMSEKNRKKLDRINIAAKMVSLLYKDLTYLTLEQENFNKDEILNLKEIIEERTEYFAILVESKKIKFVLNLEDAILIIDRKKITRVIDNLISNAIKYNYREGIIGIDLKKGELIIWDTGIGINNSEIPFMFDRYSRFNQSEGGFGVGLSIVKSVLDEYKINIIINSIEKKGTRMILKW